MAIPFTVGAALVGVFLLTTPCNAIDRKAISSFSASMRHDMVGTTRLDGVLIDDVRMPGVCETVFITAHGAVSIDWRVVGNIAAHDTGNRWVTLLSQAHGQHELSAPAGKTAENVSSSIDLLALDCSGAPK